MKCGVLTRGVAGGMCGAVVVCSIICTCPRTASAAEVAAPPRLAIVTVGGDNKALAPISDLLHVSFPTNPPVVLLERAEVDRLLAEQALSLSASVSLTGSDLLQAGKLWSVDAFLLAMVFMLAPPGSSAV